MIRTLSGVSTCGTKLEPPRVVRRQRLWDQIGDLSNGGLNRPGFAGGCVA